MTSNIKIGHLSRLANDLHGATSRGHEVGWPRARHPAGQAKKTALNAAMPMSGCASLQVGQCGPGLGTFSQYPPTMSRVPDTEAAIAAAVTGSPGGLAMEMPASTIARRLEIVHLPGGCLDETPIAPMVALRVLRLDDHKAQPRLRARHHRSRGSRRNDVRGPAWPSRTSLLWSGVLHLPSTGRHRGRLAHSLLRPRQLVLRPSPGRRCQDSRQSDSRGGDQLEPRRGGAKSAASET